MKCRTCQSDGFDPSPLGADRCSFCDGTEGGYPPSYEDLVDRITELENQLALLVSNHNC